MPRHVEVTPAYGRNYLTLKDAKAAWNSGKDFHITTGGYITADEADRHDVKVVVRYGKRGEKVGTLR